MDQRPGELNQDSESLERKEITDTEIKPRPATTADEIKSEQIVASEIERTENPPSESADEPEQIREQIEQTRSQMSETINAIEEKLSFEKISGQVSEQINQAVETAKGAVYDATLGKAENIMKTVTKGLNEVSESMGEAGSYVVSSARRNPLPLALIGLGVGMLLVQGTRSKSTYYSNGRNRRSGNNQDNSTLRQIAGTGSDVLSTAQRKAGDIAGSAYESVSNVAGTAYEGVSSAANSAYQGVSSAADSAYQGVTSLVSSTGEQVQNATRWGQQQYEHTLEENPLALGAIALAVGAVVGLAVPSTEYENQWMGETKENLVQTVEGAARDALSKVQESAGEVINNVREQAQSNKANA